jgi:hypothetical protein
LLLSSATKILGTTSSDDSTPIHATPASARPQ